MGLKFKNIQEIKQHKWAGNAVNDMPAFKAINHFVQKETNSIPDKAEALRLMSDKGMGCGRTEYIDDTEIVAKYLTAIKFK